MHTIEFIEYLLQVFFLNTYSIILDRDIKLTRFIPSTYIQQQFAFLFFIFHCIVQQIKNNICKMHLVYKYIRIYRIQIRSDFTIVFLYLQRESIDNTGYQIICIHLFHLQRRFLLFEHRHLQHLFHLKTQTLGFIIYHSGYMLEHSRRFSHCRIFQHLSCQRYGRDRCLEFMCHIIYEIILYLGQLLLTEDDIDSKNERHKQYKCEDQ